MLLKSWAWSSTGRGRLLRKTREARRRRSKQLASRVQLTLTPFQKVARCKSSRDGHEQQDMPFHLPALILSPRDGFWTKCTRQRFVGKRKNVSLQRSRRGKDRLGLSYRKGDSGGKWLKRANLTRCRSQRVRWRDPEAVKIGGHQAVGWYGFLWFWRITVTSTFRFL